MEILKITHLKKAYHGSNGTKDILDQFDFTMESGIMVAIMGPSGSGKTTLLNQISGIDKPDGGDICIDGKSQSNISIKEKTEYRRTTLGMVFQDFHLIDSLTVRDNIILPLTLQKKYFDEIEEQLEAVVKVSGIQELLDKYPSELSGGEKQRVAICRAVISRPKLILADEPTGNLDLENTQNIMEYFQQIKEKQSILMVTHDAYAASYCDEVVYFRNGKIEKTLVRGSDTETFFVEILKAMAFLGGKR